MIATNQIQLELGLRAELEKYINVAGARVWKLINDSIEQYYDNYEPSRYEREYQFFKSCIKTNPKWHGDEVEIEVYIDSESMVYRPKKEEQERPSGKQVVDWANRGLHGGLDVNDDHKVWDDPISELDRGQIFANIEAVLRSQGFTVTHA